MSIVFSGLVLLAIAVPVITLRSHLHKKYPSNPRLRSEGIVDAPLSPKGSVLINGELWMARSIDGLLIPTRAQVAVVGFEDHLILVAER
jgi:membrane-bound ClpP family serine protease